MWWKLVVVVLLFVESFASPPPYYQDILQPHKTIEDRLNKLENSYSNHMSSLLNEKVQQNRNLEMLNNKISNIEQLFEKKYSENCNYKREMDVMYKNIIQMISFLYDLTENNYMNLKRNVENCQKTINEIDKKIKSRDYILDDDSSDVFAAIDDLKTAQLTMEKNILIHVVESFNFTTTLQKKIISLTNHILWNDLSINDQLKKIETTISTNLQESSNNTKNLIQSIGKELKNDFNEYAVKVAEMNADSWQNYNTFKTTLNTIETKLDNNPNSISETSNINDDDDNTNRLDDIMAKLDDNFGKIIANQEIFLESCHRLQMDEAQIEDEISEILKKLINMLDQKYIVKIQDLKNLERVIKNHDSKVNRNLYQSNTNIISLFEKTMRTGQTFEDNFKTITTKLEDLSTNVRNQTTSNLEQSTQVKNQIQRTEDKLINLLQAIFDQLQEITNSTGATNQTLQENFIPKLNSSVIQTINEIFGSPNNTVKINESTISQTVEGIFDSPLNNTERLNSSIIQTVNEVFGSSSYNNTEKVNESKLNSSIIQTINEIFGSSYNNNTDIKLNQSESQNSTKLCKQDYLKLINIRSGSVDEPPEDCIETLGNDSQ